MTGALIPAATLILFRSGDGAPEVLMVERARSMAFAAGALVFPGGRVDPGDRALAASALPDAEPVEAAARVAAIRETIEEVGIAAGLDPMPSGAAIERMRAALAAGADFGALLQAERLSLAPDALTPFARWCPNMPERRNFDAIFFIAEAPDGASARADGEESVSAVWGTPRGLLDAADAGRHHIIFPTRRNLERLAGLGSIASARAHAQAFPVTPITPFIETRDGAEWLCIPDGLGYPVTTELLVTARRG